MNTVVTGWKPFSNPRMFAGYGRQKGWERDASGNESNEIFHLDYNIKCNKAKK